MVSTGRVSEFRAAAGNASQLWGVPLPTLAVAYRRRLAKREYDYRLMLLEDVRREALGAITDDGLARAGYEGDDAFARFRREWMIEEKRRFDPLRVMMVYRVRLLQDGDLDQVGRALVGHLYREYLEHDRARTLVIRERPPQEILDGYRPRAQVHR